jgi:hypothetical protein
MSENDIIFSPAARSYSMNDIRIHYNSEYTPDTVSLYFGTSAIFLTLEAFDRLLFEMKAFDAERQLLNGELNEVI